MAIVEYNFVRGPKPVAVGIRNTLYLISKKVCKIAGAGIIWSESWRGAQRGWRKRRNLILGSHARPRHEEPRQVAALGPSP